MPHSQDFWRGAGVSAIGIGLGAQALDCLMGTDSQHIVLTALTIGILLYGAFMISYWRQRGAETAPAGHVEPCQHPEPEEDSPTLGDLAYVSYLAWREHIDGRRALYGRDDGRKQGGD